MLIGQGQVIMCHTAGDAEGTWYGVRDEGIARSDSVEPMGWSNSPNG